jgi:hypothetical protein
MVDAASLPSSGIDGVAELLLNKNQGLVDS